MNDRLKQLLDYHRLLPELAQRPVAVKHTVQVRPKDCFSDDDKLFSKELLDDVSPIIRPPGGQTRTDKQWYTPWKKRNK